jgi:hypothetical protein
MSGGGWLGCSAGTARLTPTSSTVLCSSSSVKGKLSPLPYAAGIGLSFVNHWPAVTIYAGVALMWLIPGRRLERTITGKADISQDPARE